MNYKKYMLIFLGFIAFSNPCLATKEINIDAIREMVNQFDIDFQDDESEPVRLHPRILLNFDTNSDNENDTSNHENTTLLEDEARLKERVSDWLEKKDPNLTLKYKRLLAEEKYSPLDLTIRLRNHYLSTAKSWECLKKAKAIQKYLNEKKSFAQQDETVWLFKEEFRYLSKVMQWQDH